MVYRRGCGISVYHCSGRTARSDGDGNVIFWKAIQRAANDQVRLCLRAENERPRYSAVHYGRPETEGGIMKGSVLFLALIIAAAMSTMAQPSATQAEILILGTYHMANPGHDVFNMEADDVTSPKRQQEITQLIDVLKKFRPTKIAI